MIDLRKNFLIYGYGISGKSISKYLKRNKSSYKIYDDFVDLSLLKESINLDNLKKYSEIVTPIIKKYGGIALVRGGYYKVFSGDEFSRTVIWEFPNFETAIRCHDSKEYQDGWSIAKNTTERNLQIVEGFNTE